MLPYFSCSIFSLQIFTQTIFLLCKTRFCHFFVLDIIFRNKKYTKCHKKVMVKHLRAINLIHVEFIFVTYF